jgi:chorismate lyase/3-hydroxybenzoate synthase
VYPSSQRGRALACRFEPAREPLALDPDEHVLASIRYGQEGSAALPVDAGLVVDVPLAQLGDEPLVEVWTTDRPAVTAGEAGLRMAACGDLAFGAITSTEDVLEHDVGRAYDALLGQVLASEHPHLLRMWNVVPRINEPGYDALEGIDRYMVFCKARSLSFERHQGPNFGRFLSAASAVGGADGPLVTYFVSSVRPGERMGNARQIEAWRYPERYGPRAPSFARGTVAPASLDELCFVSGTASIVGHESVHRGDLEAQIDETLRNMEVVAEHAGGGLGEGWLLKVYLRHPAALDPVRRRLEQVFGPGTPILYLRADVCRFELDVEIEGIFYRS